jgi:hypothetical protein
MKKIYFVLVSFLLLTSCSKNFVNVDPLGNPTTAYFWHTADDINRACNAMYMGMSYEQTFGQNIFFMMTASDDVVVGRNDDGEAVDVKNFNCTGRGYYVPAPWNSLYNMMALANQVIANIDNATVSKDLINRAKGEAYFMRGFDHFWIAYLWGSKDQGVPYDGPENPLYQKRIAPQLASVIDNYKQVISDLQKAANLLPYFSSYGQGDWGRAHKAAAWAYMAKTYMYWAQYDPRREATILKFGDTFTYFGVSRQYWSTNSPTGMQNNKYMEAFSYGTNSNAASNAFINQNGNNPGTCQNIPLIRYAEILLFKAEALIQMGQNTAAAAPLNLVRNRAGLPSIASPTMADLKHERRVELAIEWSDRLMDLKRWGDYDNIRQPLHGRIHADKTDPNSPYTIQEVWPARTFTTPKDLVWPINPDEIILANGAYKQNAGW